MTHLKRVKKAEGGMLVLVCPTAEFADVPPILKEELGRVSSAYVDVVVSGCLSMLGAGWLPHFCL